MRQAAIQQDGESEQAYTLLALLEQEYETARYWIIKQIINVLDDAYNPY